MLVEAFESVSPDRSETAGPDQAHLPTLAAAALYVAHTQWGTVHP